MRTDSRDRRQSGGTRRASSRARTSVGRAARILTALIALLGLPIGFWALYELQLNAPVRAVRRELPSDGGERLPARASSPYFRIRGGESFAAVAENLAREGWVRYAWPLRFEAQRQGWDRRVIPGWYRMRPGEPVRMLLERLRLGRIEEARLTIPEGWRLPRILGLLADSAWISIDSLQVLAGDPDWRGSRDIPGPSLEGYLFPDTYRIPKGALATLALDQMLRPGRILWMDTLRAEAEGRGIDRHTVWTLASLVEAEAARAEERPRIAAVFWNRLERGMRLESDPTVLFALNRPSGRVLYRDLEVDSPYNTYRVSGLPPGPICAPGRASLRAVVHPLAGCRDLFFVARGDGSHVFSRTLDEHNRARRSIRRSSVSSGETGRQ